MSRRKRSPERWARYSEQVLRSRLREEEAKQRKIEAGPVDPLRFVPDHSEVFEVAIDHWIASGGESDPTIGILMGDDWWVYPWSLFPRDPLCGIVVPVRGRISAMSYQITHEADVPAITLWRRTWRGVRREYVGYWIACNNRYVRTWPTGQIPSGVAKLARRIQRDPDRFIQWGDAAPVRLWSRQPASQRQRRFEVGSDPP